MCAQVPVLNAIVTYHIDELVNYLLNDFLKSSTMIDNIYATHNIICRYCCHVVLIECPWDSCERFDTTIVQQGQLWWNHCCIAWPQYAELLALLQRLWNLVCARDRISFGTGQYTMITWPYKICQRPAKTTCLYHGHIHPCRDIFIQTTFVPKEVCLKTYCKQLLRCTIEVNE